MTCDELLDLTAEPARVDRVSIKLPGGVGTEQQTNEHPGEIGVLRVAIAAVGEVIEKRRELGDDLLVQGGQTLAQLRAAKCRDADLGEQHTAVAVRRILDEEEVEPAGERALGIEDVELRAERRPGVFHHLIDRRDQEVFLRVEIVVHEPGREVRLGRDALHRRLGDPVLEDRGAQTFDDLPAAWSREARPSHR